jgi:hypothetical protein
LTIIGKNVMSPQVEDQPWEAMRNRLVLFGVTAAILAIAVFLFISFRNPSQSIQSLTSIRGPSVASAIDPATYLTSTPTGIKSKAGQGTQGTARKLIVLTVAKPNGSRTYADLYAAALGNDREAAYLLFQMVRSCSSLLAGPVSPAKAAIEFDPKWCEQVSNGELDYMRWLNKSVELGYIPAVLALATENIPSACNVAQSENVIDACKPVVASVESAGKAGSVQAWLWLGNTYRENVLFPKDPVMAYGYYLAAQGGLAESANQNLFDGDEQVVTQDTINMVNRSLARQRAKLTASQLELGEQAARSILAGSACCVLVP